MPITPGIDSLISDISFWEAVGICASIVVIIGIGIESWEIFKIFKEGKFKEKWFEVAGAFFVVFGLAIEIVSQIEANDKSGYVVGALKAKASDADKIAKIAAKDAADAGFNVNNLHRKTWSIIAELYSLYEQTASHRKYFHFPRK